MARGSVKPLLDRRLSALPSVGNKRLIIVLAATLSLVGAVASLAPNAPTSERSIEIGPFSADLSSGAYSEKHVYGPGEEVNFTFYVKNLGNESETITFNALPQVYHSVYAQNGSHVQVFNGHFFWMMSQVTVMPNETYEWDFSWTQEYNYTGSGNLVPWPAYYRITFGYTGALPVVDDIWVAVTDRNECHANIDMMPLEAQPGESIEFNASGSLNSISGAEGLQYRWDWEGDGIWDADWSPQSAQSHAYLSAGDYVVKLEIRDITGANASAQLPVTVGIEAVPEFGTVMIPVLFTFAALSVALRCRRRC